MHTELAQLIRGITMAENRKKLYTRMVLADSLIELMKCKAFEKITVRELCELADVNRSTFYLHYEDIYALLSAIEEDTLAWMYAYLDELTGETPSGDYAILSSLERLFECFVKNSKHLRVLMSEQGDPAFQKRVFNMAYKKCSFSSAYSKLTLPLAEDLHFIFMVTGGIGIVQHWLKNGLKESPREIAMAICDMALAIR